MDIFLNLKMMDFKFKNDDSILKRSVVIRQKNFKNRIDLLFQKFIKQYIIFNQWLDVNVHVCNTRVATGTNLPQFCTFFVRCGFIDSLFTTFISGAICMAWFPDVFLCFILMFLLLSACLFTRRVCSRAPSLRGTMKSTGISLCFCYLNQYLFGSCRMNSSSVVKIGSFGINLCAQIINVLSSFKSS